MKIKRGMQEHIDNISKEVSNFCIREMLPFTPIQNTDKDYAEGHITFSSYKVHIRCHDSGVCYSFMEKSLLDNDESPFTGNQAAVEMIFEFGFTPLLFNAYDIHNVVDDKIFETLSFNFIKDEESAKYAVEKMMGFLKRNYSAIQKITENKFLQDKLIENYKQDFQAVYGEYDTEYMLDPEYLEDSIDDHLISRNFICNDELIHFILTKNPKKLIKTLDKAERKNELTAFEKRYKAYLDESNYQAIDNEASKRVVAQTKQNKILKVVYAVALIAAGIISQLLITFIKSLLIGYFYEDGLYIGNTLPLELATITLVISILLFILATGKAVPAIKDKLGLGAIKDKYNKPIIIGAVVLLCGTLFFSYYAVKNNAILIIDNTLYIDNQEAIKDELTFIYIEGYQYDSDDPSSYSNEEFERELYYVYGDDYEGYIITDLVSTDQTVTNDVLKQIKRTDFKVEQYKTIEAFSEKYNFSIE